MAAANTTAYEQGLRNREIAAELGLSPATESRHLANIYGKLGIATRVGAASSSHSASAMPNRDSTTRWIWG